MMLGMLKKLGNKIVSEQSRTWHKNSEDLNALPREVQDHLSLDRSHRHRRLRSCERPVARTALLV